MKNPFLISVAQRRKRYTLPSLLSSKLHPIDQNRIQPSLFFDFLMRHYGIRNDKELAEIFNVSTSLISRTRSKKAQFTDALLIAIHEEFNLSVKQIKYLLEHSDITNKLNNQRLLPVHHDLDKVLNIAMNNISDRKVS